MTGQTLQDDVQNMEGACHHSHPLVRRTIPEPLNSAVGVNAVDVTGRQADIDQLSVTQVAQAHPQPLALAPFLKRKPISLEQAQDVPLRWSGPYSRLQRCGARRG